MGGVHDSWGLCSLHHSGDEATRGSVLWNRMLLRGLGGVVTLFRQYKPSFRWRAMCSDIGKESNFEFKFTCTDSSIILGLIIFFIYIMWSKLSSKLVYQFWIWFFLNSFFCLWYLHWYYLRNKPMFSIVGLDLDKFIKFDPQVSQNICVSIHNFILITV